MPHSGVHSVLQIMSLQGLIITLFSNSSNDLAEFVGALFSKNFFQACQTLDYQEFKLINWLLANLNQNFLAHDATFSPFFRYCY